MSNPTLRSMYRGESISSQDEPDEDLALETEARPETGGDRGITLAVRRLDICVKLLEEQIARLPDSLAPMLRPAPKRDAPATVLPHGPPSDRRSSTGSYVAKTVDDAAGRVAVLIETVAGTLRRLDI